MVGWSMIEFREVQPRGWMMADTADLAVRDEERERFWADYHAAYEALQADPSAWAEFQNELELWDSTLADGLEQGEGHFESVPDLT
jgi:hypothetical protein